MIRLACLAAFLGTLAPTLVALGADPPPSGATRPLNFRRVYAPAANIQDWPLGKAPYLPMDSAQFERLLEAATSDGAGMPKSPDVQLLSAHYTARLVDDNTLWGEAILAIAYRGQAPVTLGLEPWGLAIASAEWVDPAAPQVILGTTSSGRTSVLVDRSGSLRLRWSLRAPRNPAGTIEVTLELPQAPVSRLTLDLPHHWLPTIDPGLVTPDTGGPESLRRWQLEFGGRQRILLRLLAADAPPERKPLALLRQATTYEFSQRGVDVAVQLRLDVHNEPLRRLALYLDAPLRLVSARSADQDIPWSISDDPQRGGVQVMLEFPERLQGTGRMVRLAALAPLELGSRWQLPAVRVDGVTWQEGSVKLVVPKPLELEQIATSKCRQTRTEALTAPLSGDSLELQCFTPDATTSVLLARARARLKVDQTTVIELGPSEIKGRMLAELSVRQGERFLLRAEVGSQWLIDSVEAVGGAPLIEDWSVERPDPQRPQLVVRLKQGIAPQQPVRLTVLGHHPAAPAEGVPVDNLQMLSFHVALPGRRLIELRANDAHELDLIATEDLVRVDTQHLAPADAALFSEPPTGSVFAVDAAAGPHARVALADRRPSYSADIDIDAAVDGQTLTETFTMRCNPQLARVERLLVFFSRARPGLLRWTLTGSSSGQLTARRLTDAEQQTAGGAVGGEAWELLLRLPRGGPFEARAVRSVPLEGNGVISLAALPEATSQRGTLAIRALGQTALAIDNRRLKPIPAELLEPGYFETARGAYRFEPSRDALTAEPAISVELREARQGPATWASLARLESRLALRDLSWHQATWRLESLRQTRLRVTMPAGAQLRTIAIDGVPVSTGVVSTWGEKFPLDLPSGKAVATVAVEFTTAGELPHWTRRVTPAWPELDVPVLEKQWSLWLPPGYEVPASDERWLSMPLAQITASERLFGPLGRPFGGRCFNPLRLDDWHGLWGHGETDTATLAQAEACIVALDRAVSDAAALNGRPTWRAVAERWSEALNKSRTVLLIDRFTLPTDELRADSQVPHARGDSAAARGWSLLEQARLVLLVDDEALVLAGESARSWYPQLLEPLDTPLALRVKPGPLATEIQGAAQSAPSAQFVPLSQLDSSAMPGLAMRNAERTGKPTLDNRGWSAYSLIDSDDSSRGVRIVCVPGMRSLAWAAFLGLVAWGAWPGRRPTRALLAAAAVSGVAALLLPASLSEVAAAAWLGSLCGLVYLLVERAPYPVRASVPVSSRLAAAVVRVLLLALTLGGALGLAAWSEAADRPDDRTASEEKAAVNPDVSAAPAPLDASAAAERVQKVYVPVDSEQRPTTGKYYVPEQLYRELLRRAAATHDQPGKWLLSQASYRAVLASEAAAKGLTLSELKAAFELHVFQANTEVELRLGREGVELAADGARLDGHPIATRWRAERGPLVFTVEQPGIYRLELTLVYNIKSSEVRSDIDLTIPSLPTSLVQVTLPADVATVDLPSARGQVVVAAHGELTAQLGPTGHLTIRWPEDKDAAGTLPNLDVDELVWLKLQPGSAVIDARFKFRVAEGRVRRLRLLADPRLHLLSRATSGSAVAEIHTFSGDPETIELELSEAISDQVTVDLTFLWSGTSGIGSFRMPRLEVAGARLAQRFVGVTLDAGLQHEEQLGDEVKAISVGDFAAAWGPSESKPQLAYAIPRGEAAWALASRPREPHSAIEQTTSISLGRQTALVELNALLATSNGYHFQSVVAGPPGLQIDNVSLLDEGVQRVARWSTDEAGLITLFYTGPVAGRQQLLLRGTLETSASGSLPMPGFAWQNAELKKNQVFIYRQASTLVEVTPGAGVSPLPRGAAEGRPHAEFGRLVGGFSLEQPTATAKLQLSPNLPRSHASEVISLERDHDAWSAIVDCQIQVDEGLIDALRFEVPPQWIEPFQLSKGENYELLSMPGESRRQLVIYPSPPISGEYRLKIRGRLTSPGERLKVPDVMPRSLARVERYVVLPNRSQMQELSWETSGLTVTQLPETLRKRVESRQPHTVFQVLGEHFRAALKSSERAGGTPRVRLADIGLVWRADGACHGTARFDVEPAGASQCVLELPHHLELLAVNVAEVPVTSLPAGPDAWRIPLSLPQLPQTICVVFRGKLPATAWTGNGIELDGPLLSGLEVDRTIWTVYGPPTAGAATAADSSAAATLMRAELWRAEQTTAILDMAARVASEQLPDEMQRWYIPWRRRQAAEVEAVDRLLSATVRAGQDPDSEALLLAERQLVTRLAGAMETPIKSAAAAAADLTTSGPREAPPLVLLASGELPAVVARYPLLVTSNLAVRLLTALVVAAMCLAAGVVLHGHPMRGMSLPAMVAVLGFICWAWLAPSAWGFAVLAIGVIGLVHSHGQPRRQARPATLST